MAAVHCGECVRERESVCERKGVCVCLRVYARYSLVFDRTATEAADITSSHMTVTPRVKVTASDETGRIKDIVKERLVWVRVKTDKIAVCTLVTTHSPVHVA